MILPPMVIYASNLEAAKDALIAYMGVDCIKSFSIDEQCAYVSFKDTPRTDRLEGMVKNLTEGIFLEYHGDKFKLHTQYFDI